MTQQEFENICNKKLVDMGFDREPHRTQLKNELRDVYSQDLYDYYSEIIKRGDKYQNENNIIIPFLLGICDTYDFNQESKYDQGESPDIDVDYLPSVRNYLKEKYAREQFGDDYVCNIATYTTFGLRSALIDMAKVFDLDRKEILNLTTKLGIKDDEGEILTWDKAIELYDDLREYLEREPEMAEAAKKILHRNRNMGMHASGLIISKIPIKEFVPLVRIKDNAGACSAWVEGLHGSDLGAVGLVKFDFLSLEGNMKIAQATNMVKKINEETHLAQNVNIIDNASNMVGTVSALPGKGNWTDTSYLDCPKSLAMANQGDLKMVFQYDGSPGIRRLAKQGGVNCFEDLVAYVSLFRPSALKMNMHEAYCNRKNGKEQYEIHPLLEDALGFTYNVMIYQEQIMKVLNTVGKIPLKDCETIRKAISKKKVEQFIKYKEMFVKNGQATLGWDEEKVENLFQQVSSFAGYGFNMSMTSDTKIINKYKDNYIEKEIQHFIPGDIVLSVNEKGETVETTVIKLHNHGILPGFEVTFDDGNSVTCTLDHKFLTSQGQKSLKEILSNNLEILSDSTLDYLHAENNTKRLDRQMRIESTNSCKNYISSKTLPEMSKTIICDRNVGNQMRGNIQNTCTCKKTSTHMPKMQIISMENKTRWSNSCSQNSVRNNFRNVEFIRISPKKLHGMQQSETREHNKKKHHPQPICITKKNSFRDSKKNILTSRNSGVSFGTTSFMERSESRQICFFYTKSMEIKENIKNRTLDEKSSWLVRELHNLRDLNQASGFCEWNNLDRSRWILPLLRIKESKRKKKIIIECSTTRCTTQQRSAEKKEYYFDSTQYGMFHNIKSEHESATVGMASGYAEITDTRRLSSRKIIRIKSVGERQMYDLEVASPTHNFLLPNGVITSNSHAVAYTYISSRMLYLKANHPLAFYTSVLNCTHPTGPKDYAKLKDYKHETVKHGIKVNRLNINKSKLGISATDGQVYWGFNKIRGIGDEVASRMEKMQPYANYEDFLHKFGTDAKANQAVISLRLFEGDPIAMYQFYENYKSWEKKTNDRKKRFDATVAKNEAILKEHNVQETDLVRGKLNLDMDCETKKIIESAMKKLRAAKINYNKKPNEPAPTISEPEDTSEIDKEFLKLLKDKNAAEDNFYGFIWDHPIESCRFYSGQTFEQYELDNCAIGPVEVMVRSVTMKKGPKVSYYSVEVEDSNTQVHRITFWASDYKNYQDLLEKGRFLRITVQAPSNGFSNYTLNSPKEYWKRSKNNNLQVFPID